MKTKFLYVLVSTEKDIYLEQAWISIKSLKLHNNDGVVNVLCDEDTEKRIRQLSELEKLIDEVIVVEKNNRDNVNFSRFLKTSMRKYVKGDFLFVDTDTVITGSLAKVDDIEYDVAAVADLHCLFKRHIGYANIVNTMKTIYDIDVVEDNLYYNSGVIYSKDTETSAKLFGEWHKQWEIASETKKYVYDQPALMKADKICGGIIHEIGGEYNCQILGSVKYLSDALIIHFFNKQWLPDKADYNTFFLNETYVDLKQKKFIDKELEKQIINCKNEFDSKTYIINESTFKFLLGGPVQHLYNARKNRKLWTKFIFAQINLFARLENIFNIGMSNKK